MSNDNELENFRLNSRNREEIMMNLLAATFLDEAIELGQQEEAIFVRAYEAAYPKEHRDLMESAPKHFFDRAYDLFVTADDLEMTRLSCAITCMFYNGGLGNKHYSQHEQLHFPGVDQVVKYVEERGKPIPFAHRNGGKAHKLDLKSDAKSKKLVADIAAHREERNDLEKRVQSARRAAMSVLESVRTVKTLLEAWPEVEPYIPGAAAPVIGSLAIKREDLNKAFGLPSKSGLKAGQQSRDVKSLAKPAKKTAKK